MGTGSGAIGDLTQMLNCGGCDCCNELKQKITQLESKLNTKMDNFNLGEFIKKTEFDPLFFGALGTGTASTMIGGKIVEVIKGPAQPIIIQASKEAVDFVTQDLENFKRQVAEAKNLATNAKSTATQAISKADDLANGLTDVRQRAQAGIDKAIEAQKNSFTALGKATDATTRSMAAGAQATAAAAQAAAAIAQIMALASLILGIVNTLGTLMVIFPRLDGHDRDIAALNQADSNILTTIGQVKADLNGRIDSVRNELYGQITNLSAQFGELSGNFSRLSQFVGELKSTVDRLGLDVGNLGQRLTEVLTELAQKASNSALDALRNQIAGKANLSDLEPIKALAQSALTKALESLGFAKESLGLSLQGLGIAVTANNKSTQANTKADQAINEINKIKPDVNLAKTTANQANTKADQAINEINQIKPDVNLAKTTANQAVNTSTQANNKATEAVNEITKLKTEVNTAKTTATNAQNQVNNLTPRVQQNTNDINQIKPDISTTKTTATNANTTANTANGKATEAQKKADFVITGFVPMNYQIGQNTNDINKLKQQQTTPPGLQPIQQQNQNQQRQIDQQQQINQQQQQQIQQLQQNKADKTDLECNNLLNRINQCKQNNGDNNDDMKFNNITVKNLVCTDGQVTESDLSLSVIQGTEIQIQKQFELLNHIVKHQCEKGEPYAVVPEWWQVKTGQKPQLVILYANVDDNGKLGGSRWTVTIPHYNRDKNFKPAFPSYFRGTTEGLLRLADNSKIIVNCRDVTECKRIINVYKQFLPSDILQGSDLKIGERFGVDYKKIRVVPVRCTFFANGQKDMLPTWVIDLKKKKT